MVEPEAEGTTQSRYSYYWVFRHDLPLNYTESTTKFYTDGIHGSKVMLHHKVKKQIKIEFSEDRITNRSIYQLGRSRLLVQKNRKEKDHGR